LFADHPGLLANTIDELTPTFLDYISTVRTGGGEALMALCELTMEHFANFES